MKTRILGILCVFLLALLPKVNAQQMPIFSQYEMNRFILNPAVAGASGFSVVSLTGREQWLGIPDGPSTQAFAFQGRIMKQQVSVKRGKNGKPKRNKSSGKVGLGGHVYNDRTGHFSRTGAQFSYAYHMYMRETQISLGLSASAFQLRLHSEDFVPYKEDKDDPVLLENTGRTAVVPDASFGVFAMDRNFYAGISAVNLFQNLAIGGINGYSNKRNYYLLGGYTFKLNRDYMLEPSVLIKANETLNFQTDASLKLLIYDAYWLGLTYRTTHTLGLRAGMKIEKIYLGYAFDYSLDKMRKFSYGSHEIVALLKLGSNARRYKWIERF